MSKLELSASRYFIDWLTERKISLAFTTYQAGKLFLLGVKPDGRLSGFERTFERTMGLWSDGQSLWLSSVYQIWRMENCLLAGQQDGIYDRLYVPQVGYTTGDIDIHDVVVDGQGRVVFVSTLFSCLGTTSERCSFQPLWKPPFVSRLAAEDRCHLNGLAMRNGQPAFVTACGQTDSVDGWRDHRSGGGCVIDVSQNQVVAAGLSMPHSPRWHQERLWLLNSGTGDLGFLDPSSGRMEPVAFCPGYARGMTFVGDEAVVGLSRCRQERTFSGLPLDQNLRSRNAEARCGLIVVDTRSGDTRHWLRIEGVIDELYDVVVLPEVRCPKALGFKTDEIRRRVWIEDEQGKLSSWQAAEKSSRGPASRTEEDGP